MEKPILSIVIPTKGRYECLMDLMSYILSWKEENFELLIQDNNEDNSPFINFIKKFDGDRRLNYFHEPKVISIIENSERAVQNSSGKYVCYIGDDDGVISQIIDIATWMEQNGVDSFNCAHGSYLWGDFRMYNRSKKRSLAGLLTYKKSARYSLIQLDPVHEVNVILQSGANTMARVTRVYQGILSRQLLDKVKASTGSYFPGPVPDMTNAVASAFLAEKHVFMEYPIIIAGGSKSVSKNNKGQKIGHDEIKNVSFLPKNAEQNWSKELPKYWSPPTIWAEGLFKALEKSGMQDMKERFNYPMLFAHFLMWVPEKKNYIRDFILENLRDKSQSILKNLPKTLQAEKIKSLLYEVKVFSIMLNTQNLIGLKIIKGDKISMVLDELDNRTKQVVRASGHKKFLEMLTIKS